MTKHNIQVHSLKLASFLVTCFYIILYTLLDNEGIGYML